MNENKNKRSENPINVEDAFSSGPVTATGERLFVPLRKQVKLNENEFSSVHYEIHEPTFGMDKSEEAVHTNSLLNNLINNSYVTDAVRIMPTIDLVAKAYADARFNVSGGAESTTAAINVADFQKLNSETARRVSMLVNVIGCAL